MRRISLALVSSVSLLLPLLPVPAFAFTDVTADTQYQASIQALQTEGVLQGYSDGTFKPNTTINRAEFLKILLEATNQTGQSTSCFPDVQDQWFAPYVCTAKSLGIVSGYPDGTFKPEQPISFVEAAKILNLAYKQDIPSGGDWYEPYARALESAKAIPPTIDALDQKITRGEMAEMMWIVKDKVTDQASKGYLNVKYPEVTLNLSSDAPQTATQCKDLAAVQSEQEQGFGSDMRGVMPLMNADHGPAMAPMAATANGAKSADYSQTNVQVQGVDEADSVKTDGTYIYSIAQSGQVRIVKAVPAGNLQQVGSIAASSDGSFTPSELYVQGDRLVVLGTSWQGGPIVYNGVNANARMMMPIRWGGGGQSVTRVYDITSPASPVLKRTVTFDGSLVSSRKIDNKLYLVVNQGARTWNGPIPFSNVKAADVLPQFSDSATDQGAAEPVTDCNHVMILPHPTSPQYLTVGVVDLGSDTSKIQRSVILGSGDNVYAAQDNLYVTSEDWNYRWDDQSGDISKQQTKIYRFSLDSNGATFQASGAVDGQLLNQYSMDENGNTFRVATTVNTWDGTTAPTNNLFVLNSDNLAIAGKVSGFASTEQIYAVRFMGNRAYVVTFNQIDPLFVIDLSDPRSPKILGQLKIPGYSNYLQPVDDTHLIGFGKNVDASIDANLVHESGAVYYTAVQGIKVALFDVSDVTNPKQIAMDSIGDAGSDSPLLDGDFHALFFDTDRKILAFPASVTKVSANPNPTGDWDKTIQQQVFQGAEVYSFANNGLTKLGTITHYQSQDCDRSNPQSYCYSRDISRILRIGESLYTVSDGTIMSNGITGLTKQGELRFPDAQTGPIVYPMMQNGVK